MQGLSDVCWDIHGTKLCTASDDFTLRLWDVATGQCLRTLEGHTSHAFCCCFNPVQNAVVSARPLASISTKGPDQRAVLDCNQAQYTSVS